MHVDTVNGTLENTLQVKGLGGPTPNMWSEPFQYHVGRNLEKNIGHKEDCQCSIEVIAHEPEILLQTINSRVADVDPASGFYEYVILSQPLTGGSWSSGLPIQESHQVHNAKYRQQSPINPPHQRTLRGMWRARNHDIVRFAVWPPVRLFCTQDAREF